MEGVVNILVNVEYVYLHYLYKEYYLKNIYKLLFHSFRSPEPSLFFYKVYKTLQICNLNF